MGGGPMTPWDKLVQPNFFVSLYQRTRALRNRAKKMSTRTCFIVLLMLSNFACDGSSPEDTNTSTETQTQTGTQTDTDTGDKTTSTGDSTGLLGRTGTATVGDDSFLGSEELYLIADSGNGDDVCRLRYDLAYTATRTDCTVCEWAFDLIVSNVAIVSENGVGCDGIGHDADFIDSLENSTVSYGFAFEYIGHSDMLMVYNDTSWQASTFVSLEDSTLGYDWQVGYQTY